MTSIRKPAAWDNSSIEDLMECEAGRAYILNQLDPKSEAIQPEQRCESSRKNCDAARYKIYEDGSLWFVNNAEDEVWSDYMDFVQDSLLPGLEAQASRPGMCWSEDESSESDEINAWSIDEMDQQILLRYCDDDEAKARELIGL
jgi:hypothetical protein